LKFVSTRSIVCHYKKYKKITERKEKEKEKKRERKEAFLFHKNRKDLVCENLIVRKEKRLLAVCFAVRHLEQFSLSNVM
jgi:hypothetical protein